MALSRIFPDSRRHISVGSAAEPAHPPCVSRIFDRARSVQPRGDSSRGETPRTSPPLPPIVSKRITLVTDTAKLETQATDDRAGNEFWRNIVKYKDVSEKDFLSWSWSRRNVIETKDELLKFLNETLPDEVPCYGSSVKMQSRDYFMKDILDGMMKASMAVRVMPYVISRINWKDPANDRVFRQFIPMGSLMIEDHPACTLDSLNEKKDEVVAGVVHRYPDKALFLPIAVCPAYCAYCTREWAVGANTNLVTKDIIRLNKERIDTALAYIRSQEGLHDIVVSGGDAFYLQPNILERIGDELISMPNIRRFRFASRGLAVSPQRFIDPDDDWTSALIRVSDKARQAGKHMALHTHFNHPNEISWITEKASLRLLKAGVTIRNQSVLLRGINDDAETMGTLIRKLADMVIQPYYIYQCDMTERIEHFRTPLQTLLDLEAQLRGTIAGFFMPQCVVDLPGGGGKRLASTGSYDRETGVASFTAPALTAGDKAGKVYYYYDPVKTVQGNINSDGGSSELARPSENVSEAVSIPQGR